MAGAATLPLARSPPLPRPLGRPERAEWTEAMERCLAGAAVGCSSGVKREGGKRLSWAGLLRA